MNQEGNPFAGATPAQPQANPYALGTSAPVNPYAAPGANVDVAESSGADHLIEGGRTVPSGGGSRWLGGGWRLFKQAPGTWIGIAFVEGLLLMIMALIPFIGSLALYFVIPVFMAGTAMGCKAIEDGDGLRVNHLFAGFGDKTGPLMLVGLLYLIMTVIATIAIVIAALIFGGGFGILAAMSQSKPGAGVGIAAILAIFVVAMIAFTPVMMAIWFAPALVAFHNVQPIEALKQSFSGCWRNLGAFFVYSLLGTLLAVLATIPIGLGWLVLVPVAIASMYASYRDIFVGD